MAESKYSGSADDPFPLILDAHVGGHINREEQWALFQEFFPEAVAAAEGKSASSAKPPTRTIAAALIRTGRRHAADELDTFLDGVNGDSVNVAAVRSVAARLRRTSA
jgi:hypothetical protein